MGQAARRRMYFHMLVLLLTFGALAAGVFFLLNGRQSIAQSTQPTATPESVATPVAKSGFDRLQGRWQRPDGGYVIDIKDIDSSGKMVRRISTPAPSTSPGRQRPWTGLSSRFSSNCGM